MIIILSNFVSVGKLKLRHYLWPFQDKQNDFRIIIQLMTEQESAASSPAVSFSIPFLTQASIRENDFF